MQISLRVLLSLCLIFGQFKPGVANKSAAYKQAAIGEGKGKGVVGGWGGETICLPTVEVMSCDLG